MFLFFQPDAEDNSIVSTVLLRFGILGTGVGTAILFIWNLVVHRRTILVTLTNLWAVFRDLDSRPQVLKAVGLICVAYFWHQVPLMWMIEAFKVLTYVGLVLSDLQICFFALMAEGAFRALKMRVKEHYGLLTLASSDGRLYLDEPCLRLGRQPCMNLTKLRQVHRQLAEVIGDVNNSYSMVAALITLSSRFFVTMYLYRWITSGFLTWQLVYALITLFKIFYICYRFEALKRVDKSTADMINGLDKSPLDPKVRAEFKLFLIQLKSQPMVFNAFEMFNLDFSLITSDAEDNSFVSNMLLRFGILGIGVGTAILFIWNLVVHRRTILAALTNLWAVFRDLDSRPQVLKAVGLICVAYFWHQMPLMWMVAAFKVLTYVVLVLSDLQICFFALMAEGAFRALKMRVKEHYGLLTLTSSDGRLYLDEPCLRLGRQPCMNLTKLRQVHRQLAKVIGDVNNSYSMVAVHITFSSRFFVTIYLYRWITSGFLTWQLVYALLTFFRIFYICYRFEALKRVDKSTADMINGLDKSHLDPKVRAEFKLFLIQLKSQPMVFSAFEMFNLDFSLITSTVTTTITYLMLLQQFT